MSSGEFPLEKISGDGKELLDIAARLGKLRTKYQDWATQGTTSDDACSDGIALGELGLAAELIERNVR